MAGLNSSLSPAMLHALGWALIHSLWQCAALAAVAALAMAFIRRPAIRYLVGVAALALMLAAPVATFLVRASAPVPVLQPVTASAATPPSSTPVAVFATADRAIGAIEEAPRQLPDVLPWLVAAWACGVAFFSLRFAGGFLLLEHRRRTGSHRPGEPVLALCLDLQSRLGLDRAIQYLECAWVEAPAVIGWLRPAVLLPVFALTGLSEEQFRAVIAHELAHIRRHDWLVNLFQVLVESLLFYHPAMWWLNRRIRIERELCCDEIAVSLTGSRLEYARALAQMAEWKNVSILAMAANRGPLTQRILHILGRGTSAAGQRVAGLTGGMLFLCAALAAANLLFGIAYPVQMAEAKESMKVALVSSQTAVADLARKVVLTAKDAAPPSVAPGQMDAAADGKVDTLAAPQSDLSLFVPAPTLAAPQLVASNDKAVPPSVPAPVAGSVQGSLSVLPAQQAQGPTKNLDAAPPAGGHLLQYCFDASGFSMTGLVTAPNEIRFGKFSCGDFRSFVDVTAYVQFADPADAAKMRPGEALTLKGNVYVWTSNNRYWLIVKNAKVLGGPFLGAEPDSDGRAENAPPAATHDDQAIALVSAAVPGQAGAPRTRTEPYLGCYLGFGSWTCPSYLVTPLWWCGEEYAQRQARDCPEGPLDQVDHLGTNMAGADVYAVKFRNVDMTYVIAPPGADGKKGSMWIRRGNPNGNASSSLTAITSRTGAGLIFKRTATEGGVEAVPFDRHAAANNQITPVGEALPASNSSTLPPIVCDPPQLSAVAKDLARRLCVQKDILLNLNTTGAALLKALRSFEPFPEAEASNAGPSAISCRNASDGMTSRLGTSRSTLECAFNVYWSKRDDALRRGWVNNTLIPPYVDVGSGQLPVR